MADKNPQFDKCLYFTANALARVVSKIADQEFKRIGLSSAHAYVLMVVSQAPGIGHKDLAGRLRLAPSTVTRFVDSLVHQDLVEREGEGRCVSHSPTPAGTAKAKDVARVSETLMHRYTSVLGKQATRNLAGHMNRASEQLEEDL